MSTSIKTSITDLEPYVDQLSLLRCKSGTSKIFVQSCSH